METKNSSVLNDLRAPVELSSETFLVGLKGVRDQVRQKIRVSHYSLYSEDVWDLSKEHPDLDHLQARLNFSKIRVDERTFITDAGNEKFLRFVKEYAFTVLNDPPPSRPKWSTFCNSVHRGLAALLRFMYVNSIYNLNDLTKLELDEFLQSVMEQQNASGGKLPIGY